MITKIFSFKVFELALRKGKTETEREGDESKCFVSFFFAPFLFFSFFFPLALFVISDRRLMEMYQSVCGSYTAAPVDSFESTSVDSISDSLAYTLFSLISFGSENSEIQYSEGAEVSSSEIPFFHFIDSFLYPLRFSDSECSSYLHSIHRLLAFLPRLRESMFYSSERKISETLPRRFVSHLASFCILCAFEHPSVY